jgi:uncharacterized protein
MTDRDVQHRESAKRFTMRTPSGLAYISYEEPDPRTMDLQHTVVPEPDRGQGLGATLVQEAISHARDEGKKVVATCPFVKAWLEKHPEERDVVR